jgi:hypothetical protein
MRLRAGIVIRPFPRKSLEEYKEAP